MIVENLAEANARKDRHKVAALKRIMNTESSKRDWRIINVTVNDPRPPPLTSIGRVEEGVEVRYNTEEGVLDLMEDECKHRYNLAKKGAPIMKTSLAE